MNNELNLRLVTPLQRRLFLEGIDGFDALGDEHLQLMAENMRPRLFPRGEILCHPDKPIRAMFAVIEGQVRVERSGKLLRRAYAGDPGIGAMALFSQEPWGIGAIAEEDTIALELTADDVFQIFETRSTILRFVITRIAHELCHRRKQLGFNQVFPSTLEPELPIPADGLDIVQRVQLLRRMLALSTFRVSIAFELARHTPVVSLLPGAELWRAGSMADHFYFLLTGSAECRAPNEAGVFALGPRDSIGLPDVLANGRYSFDATAREKSIALRVPAAAFEQIILDNHEFALSVLAVSASQVLKLYDLLVSDADGQSDSSAPSGIEHKDLDEWLRAIV